MSGEPYVVLSGGPSRVITYKDAEPEPYRPPAPLGFCPPPAPRTPPVEPELDPNEGECIASQTVSAMGLD